MPGRVLIAEDEPNIVESLSFLLRRAGYDVASVADGASALADVRAHPTALLILDLMLPRLNGFEVLKALRSDATLAALKTLPPHVNPAVRAFPVAARVLIDNKASTAFTVIEITGRDRRGLVHAMTAALMAQDLRIANAKISTFGHRAVDTFYVKDRFGLKIEAEPRLKAVREALMTVLQEGDTPAEPVTTAAQ